MRGLRAIGCVSMLVVALACGEQTAPAPAGVPEGESSNDVDADGFSAPTADTAAAQQAAAAELPLTDRQDFDDALYGRLDGEPELEIRADDGTPIWRSQDYAFLGEDAPASVHPGLWRQARLNALHGLFEVARGVYQVRGYDLANLTLIEGRTGWIVVDPLTSRETSAAAMALATRHFGPRRVSALIFTHSHIDHFGGVGGIPSTEDAAANAIPVVAPRLFLEEATSENVLAGPAMGRRASFMYGFALPRSARGHVDSGLGKAPARGHSGILEPTLLVDHTPQEIELDGVRFVFQYAPDSEAPAELTFYLPDVKAFCGAEIVSHTLHNLYTLRGARVRDALRWSGHIDEALQRFGEAEVVFASHHWPIRGNARVVAHLARQRDAYRYLHDQTLRLANTGLGPQEIAERIELPESLRSSFAERGYYGTVRHNVKAVYQYYFGWYDGNPAHLDPLPPVELATRTVDAMGGAEAVKHRARAAFEAGDLRWSVALLDALVFASPDDRDARELLARCYDQLGYRAESAPWRDVYLTGALELRRGVQAGAPSALDAIDLLRRMPVERFFDSMAVRIDGAKAARENTRLAFVFTDLGETHLLWLENGVLHHRKHEPDPSADVTVRLTHGMFLRLVSQQAGLRELIFSDELSVEGSRIELLSFLSMLDTPDGRFPIVTP